MAQWFRGIFKTRSAPVVTAARAALVPPPPPPEPPAPSLWERVLFWRAEFRREVAQRPTVDEVQAQDAQEQRRRLAAGTDAIARSIARDGVWMPHGDPPRAPWRRPGE